MNPEAIGRVRRVRTLAPIFWVLALLAAALVTPAALEEGPELAGGDDPGAAQAWFLARRLPAAKASRPSSLASRYLAAQAHVRRMAHHALAWKSLGPGNLGGRTRALVFDPVDPRTLYAAGVDGGIWKTVDGGASWRPLDDLMPSLAVTSLALDPGNRKVLYAGTGEGFFNTDAVRGAGIFKTTDSGRRWRQLAATATPDFFAVNRLLVSARSRTVYAATGTGVWRSRDAGVSWERVLDPQAQGGCLDLALRNDGQDDVVFAACGTLQQATVFQTLQGQKDGPWVAVLQEPGMGRTSLAIAPSDPQVIYALAASNLAGPNGHYFQGLLAVFRSTTGGGPGSWVAQVRNTDPVPLNTALLSSTHFAFQHECGSPFPDGWSGRGWYDNVIAVDPKDPDRVWAGGVDLFRSDDGGHTWGLASYWWAGEQGITSGFAHADQHALVFDPRYDGVRNQTLLVAGDGGVYRTANARAAVARGDSAPCDATGTAVRWTSLDHGYGVTQFYQGAVFPGGRTYLGGAQDLGTIVGGDAAGPEGWRQVLGRDGGNVAIDPIHPQIVYAESDHLSFVKSTDGGRTFTSAIDGIDGGSFPYISPFALDPGDPQRLWLGGDSLWTSDDGAAHWHRASSAVGGNALDLVSAVAVSPHDGQHVLAGTSQGFIARNDAAFTAAPGIPWLTARPRDGFVSSLVFDPQDPAVVYATYATFGGTHVWKSLDGGTAWQSLDGGGVSATTLPDLPVHCLAIDPRHPQRLYVGTDLGVFVSLDGGATWAVEDAGFANVVTESLVLQPPFLFAFTHGRGAWKARLTD
ncbi:MAG TPA: hypothetical protein VIA62_20775 [Thermoanaerobaculia bacterium]|jgi:photosystem II stability/assembly factor-like uncharacterized protein|nr:hypothetical protein [Thermoanaerobaculia bacterium]